MENLPKELQNIIFNYVYGDITNPVIENNLKHVDWRYLSENINAIYTLEKNLNKINYFHLYRNINAVHIIEKENPFLKVVKDNFYHEDNLLEHLCGNENCTHLFEKILDEHKSFCENKGEENKFFRKIPWKYLCETKNFMPIIEKILKVGKTHPNYHIIDWKNLSANPDAIHILEKNLDKIDFYALNFNKNACYIAQKILEKDILPLNYIEEFRWSTLCETKNLDLIKKILEVGEKHPYYNNIYWNILCSNIYAIDIIEKYCEDELKCFIDKKSFKICWINLSKNKNAIHILEKIIEQGENHPYFHKISWNNLSKNENAIHILEKNLDKINWENLCENKNIIYIEGKSFLEKILDDENNIYYDKIDWKYLSLNKNIMYLLEKNPKLFEKINWKYLSENKNFWDKYSNRCLRKLFL